MVGFFVFWGTLLLQIWPPSRYWPEWATWTSEEDDQPVTSSNITFSASPVQNNQPGLAT